MGAVQINRAPAYRGEQPDRVNELLREFEQLKSIRQNWESYWADIARRLHPNANIFMRNMAGGITQGERRTEWIYESTPVQAKESFAAVMEMMLFPRTERYHRLGPADPHLAENRDIRAYLEDVNDILFALRYSPSANFASQAHECMIDVGVFGNTSLFTDEKLGVGPQYRAVPLADLYFAANHVGIVDRVFRSFTFTPIQAAEEWGVDKLPPKVLAAYNDSTQTHKEFEWLHVVRPRKEPAYGRKDYRGMPLESCYIGLADKAIVEEGGYRAMPYATSRYTLGPRETYGRSPAMLALADIKMLNEMSRTDINASQLLANPPVLLGESGQSFSLRPGALNYDMVNEKGDPMAHPFNTQARVDITEEKMQKRRDTIESAFLVPLMRTIMDHPDMTATAVLQLAQERGILLTPTMGRQQSEFLGVIIHREIDIAAHMGILPPMPEELARSGGVIKINYESNLNRMQRAPEGVAILTTFQQLAPMVEAGHPEVMEMFDLEAIARELGEINGMPAKLILSPEQIAQNQAQKAQAAQIQGLVAAAPQLGAAAKDLAQAHATVSNVPQPQPGAGV